MFGGIINFGVMLRPQYFYNKFYAKNYYWWVKNYYWWVKKYYYY